MKNRILVALCTFSFAVAATAQEGDVSWKSTELAPGLYMLEGQGGFAGGNLGLIPLAAITVAAIESLTGDPVDFVINTHAHGDHTGANEVLHGKGATVVAHDNLRRQMVKDGSNRAALPELTFADAVTFHLNGHTAYVFHVANAHTDGDAVIHFPEVNIIHTGDAMFNKLFPFTWIVAAVSAGSLRHRKK
jgi:glyoxylase-like metal-dependent hydrolase (beta-lactamase superfamily II)